jgi:hypothetical protein
MKSIWSEKRSIAGALAAIALTTAGSTGATVIGFEDFPPAVPFNPASPSPGYAGLDWNGGYGGGSWAVSEDPSGYFPGNQAFAGNFFAWSNGGTYLDLQKHGGGTFDFMNFEGKFFTSSGYTGSVIASAYRGGIEAYSVDIPITDEYSLVSLNFLGVDDVTLVASNGANLLLDNLIVSEGGVPEPRSWVLMLLGVAGLGAVLRHSRRETISAI